MSTANPTSTFSQRPAHYVVRGAGYETHVWFSLVKLEWFWIEGGHMTWLRDAVAEHGWTYLDDETYAREFAGWGELPMRVAR